MAITPDTGADTHDDFKPKYKQAASAPGDVEAQIRKDVADNKVLVYMKVRKQALWRNILTRQERGAATLTRLRPPTLGNSSGAHVRLQPDGVCDLGRLWCVEAGLLSSRAGMYSSILLHHRN